MPSSASRALAAIASIALALAATSARAQVAGTYEYSAHGTTVQLLVMDFGDGPVVAQYNLMGDMRCPSGKARPLNIAFGVWEPAGAHFDYARTDDTTASQVVGDFSADGSTFTGTASAKLPVFVDVTQSTRRAEVCGLGFQSFVATRVSPSAVTTVPRGQRAALAQPVPR